MKKLSIIAGLLIVLSFSAHATLQITVDTDKDVYQVGENVHVYVTAYNPTSESIKLTFFTSIESSYVIDATYNWAHHQINTPFSHSIMLNPYTSKTWEFTHGISEQHDYFLNVGSHSVIGQVGAMELSDINSLPSDFMVVPEPATLSLLCLGFLLKHRSK